MGIKPLTRSAAPSDIELHIEELVLHGFPAGDRFRIADAVQQELVRLVGEGGLPGLPADPRNADRLDAGTFKVAPDAGAQSIGAQVAHNLHERLSPEPKAAPRNQRKVTETR